MKDRNVADTDLYDEIRQRVEQRHKKRQELIIHIISYVLTNIAFWIFFNGASWVAWITVGWGIGLVANIFEYYNKYGGGAERREAEIDREVEREKERLGLYEKPKNDSRMRLSDDGEIEEVVEDDADYASEQQRRG
ncbi:MAG: 2TM domain-containing protein [Chloroflexi bacterium]|nr:2TM domain-containing protein [Chloroflexota bacterium]MCC6893192.1 2TM domain-containing protein [Anaerolineae bacterium]